VECYGPAIEAASVAEASDRIRASIEIARHDGNSIEYLGALLIATDEAVFHAFTAPTLEEVIEASGRAGLEYARVVESITISSPTLADALTHLLAVKRPAKAAPAE
jgi:hypothetical protein